MNLDAAIDGTLPVALFVSSNRHCGVLTLFLVTRIIIPCNLPDDCSPKSQESFSLGTFFDAPNVSEDAAIETSGLVI